jgi:hypothetical protein
MRKWPQECKKATFAFPNSLLSWIKYVARMNTNMTFDIMALIYTYNITIYNIILQKDGKTCNNEINPPD